MDFALILSGIGAILGGTAAWAAMLSPRAKAKREAQALGIRHQREIHEGLYGISEQRDEAGAIIRDGQPGVLADMWTVKKKLDAPILNGKGNDLIITVDRIDRRVAAIEKTLRDE